jgi:hypothetical protein
LPPTAASLVMKTPENRWGPWWPWPADEGNIQMNYCPDWLYKPSIKAVTKNYVWELRSVEVPCDNLEHLIIHHLARPIWVRLTEFCCT